MIHPATELRLVNPEIGYGVFTTAPIARGTIVWILCRFDLQFTPQQAAALPPAYQPILDRYAYTDGRSNRILCWDNGRYMNHSCDPPIIAVGRDYEVAIRDIAAGEEITCDYGGLNLAAALACRCGATNCRGTISGEDLLRRAPALDRAVRAALGHARDVDQPLLPFARDAAEFWAWVDDHALIPSHRDYLARKPTDPP